MKQILLIIGKKNGSDIIYTENYKIIVQSSSCSSLQVVFELGNQFYRPAVATMKLIRGKCGIYQKVPYLIEMNRLLLFPTMGLKNKECCWINYYCIKDLRTINGGTEFTFYDYSIMKCVDLNFKYYLPIDRRTIVGQMKRSKLVHEDYLSDKKDIKFLH